MNPQEAEAELARRVQVSSQLVGFAKAYLLTITPTTQNRPQHWADILEGFLKDQGIEKPQQVVVYRDVEIDPQLSAAAGAISCELAMAKAVWELAARGRILWIASPDVQEPSQQWTTVLGRSSGNSGEWHYAQLAYSVPRQLVIPPWAEPAQLHGVLDSDVYLNNAGLTRAHDEIRESVEDAIDCLDAGLFRPAVVLLGRAMEGAWIECGRALAAASLVGNAREKVESALVDPRNGLARKIEEVERLLRREPTKEQLQTARMSSAEIDRLVLWARVLREARNGIHFGNRPVATETYERAVVLFMESINCFRLLYDIAFPASTNRSLR